MPTHERTEAQLERRIAMQNRRAERHDLQERLFKHFEGRTLWGKLATSATLRAGAKLVARAVSAKEALRGRD
jgi:hypothetical protein